MRVRVGPEITDSDMAELLARFLTDQARRPFVWGVSDCAMFIADWVSIARNVPDPAAGLRGCYSDRCGANKLIGGRLALTVEFCAARAGLAVSTSAPAIGDIAVLRGPGGDLCAIRTAIGWAVRDDRKIRVIPLRGTEVLQCWTV